MATILQTDVARGLAPHSNAYQAGVVTAVSVVYALPTALTTSHIVELFALPAGCVPVSLRLTTHADTTSKTVDVGIMSGSFGDPDTGRTCGAEFGSGVDLQSLAVINPTIKELAAVAADGTKHRGIGIKPGATIAAAGQKIYATLEFMAV